MIKMREIAELTGYSLSTVSRVLNNKGDFSEETKQKIHQVVDSLNYKPRAIENMISNTSYTIGLFIPEKDAFISNDPALSSDLPNLKEEIEKLGNVILLATNTQRTGHESISSKIIEERKIDAAIVVGPYVDDKIVQLIIHSKIPYIVTNGRDYAETWNFIDYDNYGAANAVIEYLYTLGHRNIGIISGPPNHLVNRNRMDACKNSFEKYGLELSEDRVYSGPFSHENGYTAAKALLTKNKGITAIFAFDDVIALGAIKAINGLGLKVPDDISVVGFDDIEMSQYSIPSLTTVKRFKYDIYQLVARLIIDMIENKYIKNINITLNTELIIRDSCKKL